MVINMFIILVFLSIYESLPLSCSCWFLFRYFMFLCTHLTAHFLYFLLLFSVYMKTICTCMYICVLMCMYVYINTLLVLTVHTSFSGHSFVFSRNTIISPENNINYTLSFLIFILLFSIK